MVLTISTNTAALNVQRNLNEANEASASSLAKLSSGSRVPTAKDDAASLAIGSRVEAEIAGLKQASTNASQATSLLQIADGAYGEINDILIRQESLAIQSASGQLSDTERAIIDSEFQQLNDEVDRIAVDTEFNGNQLLNGGTVTASVEEVTGGNLASKGLSVSADTNSVKDGGLYEVTYDETSEELTVTNRGTDEKVTIDITDQLNAVAGAGNDLTNEQEVSVNFGDLGIEVTLNNDFERGTAIATAGAEVAAAATGGGTVNLGDELTSNLVKLPTEDAAFDSATNTLSIDLNASGNLAGSANSTLTISVGGATAVALDGTADITLAANTSYEIFDANGETVATFQTGTTNFAVGSAAGSIDFNANGLSNSFSVDESAGSTADFSFKVGTGTQAQDDIAISVDAVTTAALGTSASSVDTQANANLAIDTVKTAIDNLQGSRANIGASLSRLDFASSNLSVAIENQSAAKSGLMDVDMASETTNYAAQQVIVQAGVSLLAQANQRPSQLTSLIG